MLQVLTSSYHVVAMPSYNPALCEYIHDSHIVGHRSKRYDNTVPELYHRRSLYIECDGAKNDSAFEECNPKCVANVLILPRFGPV
jgi:hypothetical protein